MTNDRVRFCFLEGLLLFLQVTNRKRVKRNSINIILIAVFVLICGGACRGRSDIGRKLPDMRDYTKWTISGVAFKNKDFSGLDFNMDSTRFVGVFNSAGVYWLEMPSDADTLVHAAPLLAMDEKSGITRDLEAICVDRKSGDIYLGQERRTVTGKKSKELLYEGNSIYRLSAPDYTEQTLLVSFDTTLIQRNNSAIEGLAILGNGHFLVGREGSRIKKKTFTPALIEWSADKGVVSVKEMPENVMQVADVVYDKERECLWITDSDIKKQLYMCSLDGEVIASYDIPFIRNAEAICIDRSRGCIWIGSDEKPSKLYRIRFDNL